MRLIDADALKKDLTRFYDNEVTAKRLIDEQPTIEPMRWISAFDKFPDNDGEYLTVIKDHEGLFVEITEFMKDRWVVMYGNDDDYHEVSNVIAWMPIPAVVYERGAE